MRLRTPESASTVSRRADRFWSTASAFVTVREINAFASAIFSSIARAFTRTSLTASAAAMNVL